MADGVARVTLDDPAWRNIRSGELVAHLTAAFDDLKSRDDAVAVRRAADDLAQAGVDETSESHYT